MLGTMQITRPKTRLNTVITGMVAIIMGAVDKNKSLAYRIRNLEIGLKRLEKLSIPSTLQAEVDNFKNSGTMRLRELNDEMKEAWLPTECGYQASEAQPRVLWISTQFVV